MTVRVSISLRDTPYEEFDEKRIVITDEQAARIDREALGRHFDEFGAYEWAKTSITDEELERARQDGVTYTTAEVLEHLRSL